MPHPHRHTVSYSIGETVQSGIWGHGKNSEPHSFFYIVRIGLGDTAQACRTRIVKPFFTTSETLFKAGLGVLSTENGRGLKTDQRHKHEGRW